MTGYHQVKTFVLNLEHGKEPSLPVGWKPFATTGETSDGFTKVLCRKWVRNDGAAASS